MPDRLQFDKDELIPKSDIPCTNAIKGGICHADCCRIVIIPFLQFFYDSLAHRRCCEPDEEFRVAELVYPYREDTICVFLNQEKNLCSIYPIRPQVCSRYGTTEQCRHFTAKGKRLTRAEKRDGDYETQESVKRDFELLKRVWRKARSGGRPDHEIVNDSYNSQAAYTEVRSLATPEMGIRMLQKIAPWMVIDMDDPKNGGAS